MGFHIRYHCHNFMDTVDSLLECRVDRERYDIHRGGRRTAVREFPISIDFEELNQRAQAEGVDREIQRLRQEYRLGDRLIGIGLDRLDYTKGIPDRFRAIGRFLEKYPDWRERFTFIQAAAPSRSSIPAYQSLAAEVDRVADEVNARFGNARGQPILHLKGHCSQLTLMAMRRMSRFCAVSSLHDGMNLVAKEYAAARFDEDGVLILSPFTGAARELTDALLVNPYAPDHFAEAIRVALEMEPEERCRRMRRMRAEVRENNIYKWAGDIITALTKFDPEGSLWSMPSVPGQGSRAS
jgi:trehalose 6-phosphate synthase